MLICFILTVILFLSLDGKNSHTKQKKNEHQPQFIPAKYIQVKSYNFRIIQKIFSPYKIGRKIRIEYSAWVEKSNNNILIKRKSGYERPN